MKKVDIAVLVLFIIGLIILCFLQQCGLDIYFLIFGFAVAIISLIMMIYQRKKNQEYKKGKTENRITE